MKNQNDKGHENKDSVLVSNGSKTKTVQMSIDLDNITLLKRKCEESFKSGSQNKDEVNDVVTQSDQISIDTQNFKEGMQSSVRNMSYSLDIDNGYKVTDENFIGLNNGDLAVGENLVQVQNLVMNMHPTIKLPTGDLARFPLCKTNTRCINCCRSKDSISELFSLGLGIVAYFQTLKAMTILFLIISLINIPLIVIYYSNHPERKIATYQDMIFKTTIGNIGSFLFNCISIDFSKVKDINQPIPIYMNCASYHISSILAFAPSKDMDAKVENDESCHNFSSLMKLQTSPTCDYNETITNLLKTEDCLGKKECQFEINYNDLKILNSCIEDSDIFYLSYTCHDKWVKILNTNLQRTIFPFIAVFVDLLGMLFLIIVLFVTSRSHQITKKHFKENLIQISDYTILFEDLNLKTSELNKEIEDFLRFIQKTLNDENYKKKVEITDKYADHLIYDFAYPIVTDYKLDLVKKANKLHKNTYISEDKLQIMREKIRDSLTEQPLINEMFITFTNQTYKNHLEKIYSRNKCSRCFLICRGKRDQISHLYYKDKWLQINKISEQPSNIIWENVTYLPIKRCLRKLFSIILSLVILSLPFALATMNEHIGRELNKKFNSNIDCTKQLKPTKKEVLEELNDSSISPRNQIKTYCFCYYSLFEDYGKVANIKVGTYYPCKEWIKLFTQSLACNTAIFCVVPLLNVIFTILLDYVTTFERNKTLSKYYSTLMIRIFVLQLLNTSIILVIVNMLIISVKSWKEYFPFFTGQFQDMDPDWYITVGTSIIICMIINIVTPHSYPIFLLFWNKFKVCLDKRGNKPTKCKTRKEYLNIYVGSEFNISVRYATILTTITVVLLFSSGMPILYLCAFFFLLLTYWIDKFLILKFYRLPPKTDLFLDHLTNITLYFVMLIHLAFGIWTYGNENVLSETALSCFSIIEERVQDLLQIGGGISDSYYRKAFNRILFAHNLIIIAFIVLFIMIILWKFFISNICSFKKKTIVKTKTIDLYESMKLECIYSNYNTRRALYRKSRKNQCNYLNNDFYKWRIDYEKEIMIGKVQDLFDVRRDISKIMNQDETINSLMRNFNKEIPKVITYIKENDIKIKLTQGKKIKATHTLREMNYSINNIERDYTYHVIENPKYQDFAYYYIFSKEQSAKGI